MSEQLRQGVMVSVPDPPPQQPPPRWQEPREKAVPMAIGKFQECMDRQVRNGCSETNPNR